MKNISLKNKKIFVFDWDGTLFDSMSIKVNSFTEVLVKLTSISNKSPNDLSNKVRILYKEFSGLPRRIVYDNVIEKLGLNVNSFNYNDFDEEFTRLNKIHLLNANIFKDTDYFLNYLARRNKIIFISSSVPQEELNYFTGKILRDYLIKKISGILGSEPDFSKGADHIKFILKKTSYLIDEIVFIGDDIFDYNLSRQAGVDFILINRENHMIYDEKVCQVGSLTELEALLNE
ncbi:MAG: HAD family hydrolase [Candidatus Humimicrobiaceae bacterium]